MKRFILFTNLLLLVLTTVWATPAVDVQRVQSQMTTQGQPVMRQKMQPKTVITSQTASTHRVAKAKKAVAKTVEFSGTEFAGQGTSGTGSAISLTKDGVTISCDKGYGQTNYAVRCYANSTLTISSSTVMEKIAFQFYSTSYTGNLDSVYVVNALEWEQVLSKQARFEKITVYLAATEEPAATWGPVTVQLDPASVSDVEWSNVGLWAWVTNGSSSVNVFDVWPGVPVSKDPVTGWYSYTFEDLPAGELNIIWNDYGTNGHQTNNIENVAANTCYKLTGYDINNFASYVAASCPSAEEEIIPTVADLQGAGYDLESNAVFCYKFDGEICSGVVFTGTYNNWSSITDSCARLIPLAGFEGWYVVAIPAINGEMQGKPIALMPGNIFSWDYQAGDAGAWIYKGGNVLDIVAGYGGEANIYYYTPGAYIYEIAYWKNHSDPCAAVWKDYTIKIYAPDACEDMKPAVWGGFNNWQSERLMQAVEDGSGRTYYTATIQAIQNSEYKFRAAGDTTLSWNEIMVYSADDDQWLYFDNFKFGEETIITYDFSDNSLYRFSQCEKAIEPIVINCTSPMTMEYYSVDGDWYLYANNEQYGVYLDLYNSNSLSPVGEYAWDQFYQDYTQVYSYSKDMSYKTTSATATVIERNDSILVDATLVCEDGNTYIVHMWYARPAASRTISLTMQNAQLQKYDEDWQLVGYSANKDTLFTVVLYGSEVSGVYSTGQMAIYGDNYNYIYTTDIDGNRKYYYFKDGSITVNYNESTGTGTLTGSLIAQNSSDTNDITEFVLDISIVDYQPYANDATVGFEGVFEGYFTDTDYFESENRVNVFAGAGDKWLALSFFSATKALQPGTYEINNSADKGTVQASSGVNLFGSYRYSLISTTDEAGNLIAPTWFMVSGTVTVAEDGTISIDALNSNGRTIRASAKPSSISVADAIAIAAGLPNNASTEQIYVVEGYVIDAQAFNPTTNKQLWYMADDAANSMNQSFQAYYCTPTYNGEIVKVLNGDKVLLTGKITKYVKSSGSIVNYEIENGTATFVSMVEGDRSVAVEEENITASEAMIVGSSLAPGATSTTVYNISGYVTSIAEDRFDRYGDMTFYIADVAGGTDGFYVYRGKTADRLEVGDKISVRSQVYNYSGIIETVTGAQVTVLNFVTREIHLADVANYIDFQALSVSDPYMTSTTVTSEDTYTLANGTRLVGFVKADGTEASNSWNVKDSYNTRMPMLQGNRVNTLVAGTCFRAASHTTIELGELTIYEDGKLIVYFQPNGDSERGVTVSIKGYEPVKFVGSGVRIDGTRPAYAPEFFLPAGSYEAGDIVVSVEVNTCNIYGIRIDASYKEGIQKIERISVAEALEIAGKLEAGAKTGETYIISGYVTGMIGAADGGWQQYGNQIFWIADVPGTAASNAEGALEIYQGVAPEEIKVGDYVSVTAQLTNYNGLLETVKQSPVALLYRPSEEMSYSKVWPIILDNYTYSAWQNKIVYDFRPDSETKWLYMWENTYQAGTGAGLNFYGNTDGYLPLVVGNQGWAGAGFNVSGDQNILAAEALRQAILAEPDKYYLHMAIKSTDNYSHAFYMFDTELSKFVIGDHSVYDGAVLQNFPRTGEWHEIYVPMNKFIEALSNAPSYQDSRNIFVMLSEGVQGAQLDIDAVFFCKVGEETPEEETYTVDVYLNAPPYAPAAGVEIIGSFVDDTWSHGIPMTYYPEDSMWVAAIQAKPSDEFKFREAGTWDNEIQYYDEENEAWYNFPNLLIGDYLQSFADGSKYIYFNLSNPNYYRWTIPNDTQDTVYCYYEIDMTDSYGDGWNDGAVLIQDGNHQMTYTMSSGSHERVRVPYYGSDILYFRWQSGYYDSEVGFSIIANGGNIFTHETGKTLADGQLLTAIAENICEIVNPYELKNLTGGLNDNRELSFSWDRVTGAASYSVTIIHPYGYEMYSGFRTEENTFTVGNLDSDGEYTILVAALTADGAQLCEASYTVNVQLPVLESVHVRVLVPTDCGMDITDGLWIIWNANDIETIAKMTPESDRIFEFTFSPNAPLYGYSVINKASLDTEGVQATYGWYNLSKAEHCSEVGPTVYEGGKRALWSHNDCQLADHNYRVSDLKAVSSPGKVDFSWKAVDKATAYYINIYEIEADGNENYLGALTAYDTQYTWVITDAYANRTYKWGVTVASPIEFDVVRAEESFTTLKSEIVLSDFRTTTADSRTIDLTWNSNTPGLHYAVYLYIGYNYGYLVKSAVVNTTSYSYTPQLPGYYYWYVRPLDANDQPIGQSYYGGNITLDGQPKPFTDLKAEVDGQKITYTWKSNVPKAYATVFRKSGTLEMMVFSDQVEANQLVITAESDGVYTLRLQPMIESDGNEWTSLPEYYEVSADVFTTTPTYAVTINAGTGGYISPENVSGEYPAGAIFEVVAYANDDYYFAEWSDGEKNQHRTIVVTDTLTLTALFEPIPMTNYTIRLYAPDACEEFKPAIVGSMTNWNDNIPMTETKDSLGRTMFEATIRAQYGEWFKFREVNDYSWDNEIVYRAGDYWYTFGDNLLADDTLLTFDYSDNENYRYQQCYGNVRLTNLRASTADSIRATLAWNCTSDTVAYEIWIYYQGSSLVKHAFTTTPSYEYVADVPGDYTWNVRAVQKSDSLPLSDVYYGDRLLLYNAPKPVFNVNGEADGHQLSFVWQTNAVGTYINLYRYSESGYEFITYDTTTNTNWSYEVDADGIYAMLAYPIVEIEPGVTQILNYEGSDIVYVKAYLNATYTVVIDVTEGGVIYPNNLSGTYPLGAQLSFETYTKEFGYRFVGWSDGVKNSYRTLTVEGDTTIIAIFEKIPEYSISVKAGNGGQIKVENGEFAANYTGKFMESTEIFVAARANDGFSFTGWSDGATNASRYIRLSQDTVLTANFSRLYTLTLNAQNGTILVDGAEAVSRTGNTYTYSAGAEIVLTAVAAEGYRFMRWNDGVQTVQRTITLNANAAYTAIFEPMSQETETYSVMVGVSGNGRGEVTYINGTYPAGQQLELKATPADNSIFAGWSDGNTDNPRNYVVSKNDTISAIFTIKQVSLTISAGEGGTVNDTVANGTYEYGTFVTISAKPDENYIFAGWSDGDMNAERRIYLVSDQTLTALFEAIPYFTLRVAAGNGGTILADTMSAYGASYTAQYEENVSVYLSARANDGYRFVQWSDGIILADRYVVMNKDRDLTAEFGQVVHITLTSTPGGSVILSGDSFEKVGDVYTVAHGATVQIAAVEDEGYLFTSWSDGVKTMQRVLTATQDTTLSAQFELAASTPQYMVSITTDGTGKGSVNVESKRYYEGTELTLIATPNTGSEFTAWVVDDEPVDTNPLTITVTKAMEIKAVFTKKQVMLTLRANEGGIVNTEASGTYDYGSFVDISAKANDHYTFTGWSDGVTEAARTIFLKQDTVLTASFEAEMYTITFKNWDGSVIESKQWKYGDMPKCDSVPVRPAEGNTEYEFEGWTPAIKAVTADATYTATFTTKDKLFSVIFYDWKWNVVDEQKVEPGKAAVLPEAPERAGYEFVEWKVEGEGDLSNVQMDIEAIATYRKMEEGIDLVETTEGARKVFRDGNIYIIRGGKTYSVTGKQVE